MRLRIGCNDTHVHAHTYTTKQNPITGLYLTSSALTPDDIVHSASTERTLYPHLTFNAKRCELFFIVCSSSHGWELALLHWASKTRLAGDLTLNTRRYYVTYSLSLARFFPEPLKTSPAGEIEIMFRLLYGHVEAIMR